MSRRTAARIKRSNIRFLTLWLASRLPLVPLLHSLLLSKGIVNYSAVYRACRATGTRNKSELSVTERIARTTETPRLRKPRRRCIIDEGAPAGVRKRRARSCANSVEPDAAERRPKKKKKKKKKKRKKERRKEKKKKRNAPALHIADSRIFSSRGVAGTLETLASRKLNARC